MLVSGRLVISQNTEEAKIGGFLEEIPSMFTFRLSILA